MTRILVSAAEPSADRYIARLIPALRDAVPGAVIDAIGGPATRAAGATMVHAMDDLQAFGIVETVRGLPAHVRLYRDLRAALRRGAWDLIVLCDYPGWHVRVGQAARAAGVPVLYYVAPQLWAWGAWRARALRRAADRIAVVLPFEEPYFAARGLPAHYVGHPLLDESRPGRAEARRALGLAPDARVLAVLPGARPDDVRRHWPGFRAAAEAVRRGLPAVEIVIGGVPGRTYGGSAGMRIAAGGAVALAAADAAICKSGTSTLEAALADVPAVVSYRLHPASWWVARRAVRLPWVSLASLIAERPVHEELLQGAGTPAALAQAAIALLDESGHAEAQRQAYAVVRQRLGGPGAAVRVAALARELAA